MIARPRGPRGDGGHSRVSKSSWRSSASKGGAGGDDKPGCPVLTRVRGTTRDIGDTAEPTPGPPIGPGLIVQRSPTCLTGGAISRGTVSTRAHTLPLTSSGDKTATQECKGCTRLDRTGATRVVETRGSERTLSERRAAASCSICDTPFARAMRTV